MARWLKKRAEVLPPLNETLLPAEQGDVLALDELWSFVGSKADARRVWIARCRQTRQVVAFFCGRSLRSKRPGIRASSSPALTSLLPPQLKQDSHQQPTALASTPTPKAKQEPDQHPVPFEKQVETATADFETLLKNRRHALLGDRPMSHEPVDTFEKLINQLKTKKGAPMAELRNIYTQMEALGPAFNQGLHLINAHKLGEVVDELKAAALRPRQLAKNDDEVQQAGKISDRLLAEVSELQDEAIKQNSWVSYKIDTLKENLRDTTPKIAYARETDRKPDTGVYVGQAEGSELRGLSETVISKVLTPILHSDEAR